MKTFGAFHAASIIALLPLSCSKPESAQSDPPHSAETKARDAGRLQFASQRWDFGVVRVGTELRRKFQIGNNGPRPITVKRVRRACGCLIAEVKPKVIPPGESAQLEVEMETHAPKELRANIVVEFEEPDCDNYRCNVVGLIVPPVQVWPSRIEFDDVSHSPTARKVVRVENFTERDFRVEQVDAPEWLTVTIHDITGGKTSRGRQTWALAAVARRDRLDYGRHTGLMHITTDCEQYPSLEVACTVHRPPPYRLRPPRFFFGEIEPGRRAVARLTVQSDESEPLSPADVQLYSDSPEMALKVDRGETGDVLEITATLKAPSGPEYLQGHVELRVRSHPPQRVPVVAHIVETRPSMGNDTN